MSVFVFVFGYIGVQVCRCETVARYTSKYIVFTVIIYSPLDGCVRLIVNVWEMQHVDEGMNRMVLQYDIYSF